ncbi:hypothetical protein D8674_003816 [Pyrus ussuriensis x Pyrus communis]|uniref:Uncharacterized protein n=1 Tax=Pyrus ussuriensis x Pyrus communis TaxID=2448454 RepID=A0A5N5FMC2_9ROSA|nr:hypothetical protein D8674_003816 [Pyrus ussuriensis x Pyrus communis]
MPGKKCQICRSNETTPILITTFLVLSRYQAHNGQLNAQNQAGVIACVGQEEKEEEENKFEKLAAIDPKQKLEAGNRNKDGVWGFL